MARTIGTLVAEARTLLQDKVAAPAYRYSDAELLEAFNAAMAETRTKRPDLFLALGLRAVLPSYTTDDLAVAFPLDTSVYAAFVYYVAGRTELREDPYATDARAVTLMNKYVSQLLSVTS